VLRRELADEGVLAHQRAATLIAHGPDGQAPSRRGRLGQLYRRLVIRALRHYSHHQQRVDEALLESLRELRSLLGELEESPALGDPTLLRTSDPEGREAIGYREATAAGASEELDRRLEEIFRGSESFIRERRRPYLALLVGREPVLELGCGRGELLDLLAEADLSAVGVDSDPAMVARCRAKGHRVEQADGLAYLAEQPAGSLGAIVSAQLIEHLPYAELLEFLRLALRALRPGGILVAETANPHSGPALKTFWVDLTHQKPIFPETAVALSRQLGFAEARILFPHGSGRLIEDRRGQGEYALVARRAAGG